MDKRVFLKVKLKSLAEEARIIKREESKRKVRRDRWSPGQEQRNSQTDHDAKHIRSACADRRAERRAKGWYPMSAQELHELHRHRLDVVRVEARLTNIAYAWIRGRELKKVDLFRGLTKDQLLRAVTMARKYGDPKRVLCVGRFNLYGARVTEFEYFQDGHEDKKVSVLIRENETIFTEAPTQEMLNALDEVP